MCHAIVEESGQTHPPQRQQSAKVPAPSTASLALRKCAAVVQPRLGSRQSRNSEVSRLHTTQAERDREGLRSSSRRPLGDLTLTLTRGRRPPGESCC